MLLSKGCHDSFMTFHSFKTSIFNNRKSTSWSYYDDSWVNNKLFSSCMNVFVEINPVQLSFAITLQSRILNKGKESIKPRALVCTILGAISWAGRHRHRLIWFLQLPVGSTTAQGSSSCYECKGLEFEPKSIWFQISPTWPNYHIILT